METKPIDSEAKRSLAGLSDEQLVGRTLGGERAAFDQLIRQYQRQAVAVSYRLVGNAHDALEVTQEAFLKAFVGLGSLRQPHAFGGWLMRIVSNLSLNLRRGRKIRRQSSLEDALVSDQTSDIARDAGPLRRTQSPEMGRRLMQALEQLPRRQRLAITMFTLEGLPQKQVAGALGCSVESVKWHVFQGRKKLKELLKEFI